MKEDCIRRGFPCNRETNERGHNFVGRVGTCIEGRHYDLIHVDFEQEHPAAQLVFAAVVNPGEIGRYTDRFCVSYIRNYIFEHLKSCDGSCLGEMIDRIIEARKSAVVY